MLSHGVLDVRLNDVTSQSKATMRSISRRFAIHRAWRARDVTRAMSSSNERSHKAKSLEDETRASTRALERERRARSRTWREVLLSALGYYGKESEMIRGSEALFAEVARASDAEGLYVAHGVTRTFASAHAMRIVHVWMCLGRLRKEGEDGKKFSQMFYEAFQDDVERRVHEEGVRVRVRKWLQDLERTFYGNAISYDKALEIGGGELVKALHRNVFDGQGDEKRAKTLERYVRHQLASLALTPTEAVMEGRIKFSKSGDS